MNRRMFNIICGLYPPEANSTPCPSYDNQKCVETLPDVPQGTKLPPVHNHCLTGPLGWIPASFHLPKQTNFSQTLTQTPFLPTGSVCPLAWLISYLLQPPTPVLHSAVGTHKQPAANSPIAFISSGNISCSNLELKDVVPHSPLTWHDVFISQTPHTLLCQLQTIFFPTSLKPLWTRVGKLQPIGQIWLT